MNRHLLQIARVLVLAAAVALPALGQQSAPPSASPQAAVEGVTFTLPPGADPVLRADFALPRAEKISSVEITANGKPADKDKVNFWSAHVLTDHKSAILVVVDNTVDMVASESLERIRAHLLGIANYAEMPVYSLGLATFDRDINSLVPLGGTKAQFEEGVKKVDGKGVTTEGYRSMLSGIAMLREAKASRRYLVVMSNGRFEDTAYKHEDVVKAALEAKVVIFGVGFPANPKMVPDGPAQVQRLERVAAETRGLSWRADAASGELPPDFVSSLMASTISGGRVDFTLTGQTAPLTVDYRVTTENRQMYSFSTKLETLPAAAVQPPPVPAPNPANPTPAPATNPATPTPAPGTSPTPATPTPTDAKKDEPKPADKTAEVKKEEGKLDLVIKRLKEHPVLAGVAGVALLLGLVLLVLMLKRLFTSPPAEPAQEYSPFPPPSPIDLNEPFIQDTFNTPLDHGVTIPQSKPRGQVLAWLEGLDAERSRYDIEKSAVRIGRKTDNDIVIKNDSVSGHHAEIIRRGDQYIITDLDSPNHVYINNKRVEKSNIEHNDLIELGEVRFRFFRADRT